MLESFVTCNMTEVTYGPLFYGLSNLGAHSQNVELLASKPGLCYSGFEEDVPGARLERGYHSKTRRQVRVCFLGNTYHAHAMAALSTTNTEDTLQPLSGGNKETLIGLVLAGCTYHCSLLTGRTSIEATSS